MIFTELQLYHSSFCLLECGKTLAVDKKFLYKNSPHWKFLKHILDKCDRANTAFLLRFESSTFLSVCKSVNAKWLKGFWLCF